MVTFAGATQKAEEPRPSRIPAHENTQSAASRRAGSWDVHVGKRLREGRMSRGLNQAALSDAAGISYQQVQKYERGVNRISPDRLVAFADALDVTPGWFFEGRDGLIGGEPSASPMVGLSASDLAVARDVSQLAPPVRQKVVGLIRALVEERD